MAKRFAVPGVLCLTACSQYTISGQDPDGGGTGDGKCPAIEVTPTSIDFGNDFDIVAGTEPINQVVEVTNVGAAPLHILDLYLAQGEPSYKVSPMSSLVLNVGATAQFTVTFDPKQPFEHPEQILIDSDDCETPTAAVDVNGVGLAPQIEVDPLHGRRPVAEGLEHGNAILRQPGDDRVASPEFRLAAAVDPAEEACDHCVLAHILEIFFHARFLAHLARHPSAEDIAEGSDQEEGSD
jgi:hypothetical protein